MDFIDQYLYNKNVLSTVAKWIREGMAVLKKEDSYNKIIECRKYLNGVQGTVRSATISKLVDNRIRRGVYDVTAALTDIRQIWAYKTCNISFQDHEEIFNKLAKAWWLEAKGDRALSTAVIDSHCSASYLYVKWDSDKADIVLLPLPTRNVIPIGPVYSDSIQDWQGAIIRQVVDGDGLSALYPDKKAAIDKAKGFSFFGADSSPQGLSQVFSTAFQSFAAGSASVNSPLTPSTVELLHIYFKDPEVHKGVEPIQMGTGTSGEYTVMPGKLLYPRGRFIAMVHGEVLYDGPNPYWHGKMPLVQLKLEPIPETLLGASPIANVIALQDSLNECLRGFEDGMRQWVRRGVVADSRTMPKSALNAIDTRKDGMKIHLSPNGGGEGFKVIDGPHFDSWLFQFMQYLRDEIDEQLGVRDLKAFAQFKQMPSKDTVDAFMDSLTPGLRLKARMIELALSEIAEMMIGNFLQYYTAKKRFQILGKDGLSLEDFDYDPETLVPLVDPEDQRDRSERAITHQKNFTFTVAPNSFLSISHTQQKMLLLQLYRDGAVDTWTMWDALDIPNTGETPAENIPERIELAKKMGLMQGPTREMTQLSQQAQILQLQQQMIQMQQQALAVQGQAMQMGAANPEMMQAMQGMEGPPKREGRPPSGQQPPQMIMKDGGTRMVISESGR